MTRTFCLCFAFAITLAAGAADAPKDAEFIQGTWTPAKAELAGNPMPDEVLKSIMLKLDHGNFDVLVAGQPDKGTYTLEPASKPKVITIKGTDGPNKGKTIPAIYELKGDSLRICYDLSGAKHPPEFKTASGTRLFLVTYQRKKP
jgi:uncharacterized protein (TIGR03067 family)